MKIRLLMLVGLLFAVFGACQKSEAPPPDPGDKLDKPYCNDPEAINYNWGFPGTPDNSTCFYPDEVFQGTYTLTDSVLASNYQLDTASVRTFDIIIKAVDRKHLLVSGYVMNEACTLQNMAVTADRFYKASIDSTFVPPPDSTFLKGLTVCDVDTINGYLIKDQQDTNKLHINFTIFGDTGMYFRKGTAIRK